MTQRGMQAFTAIPMEPFKGDLNSVGFGLQRTAVEERTLGYSFVLEQAHHSLCNGIVVRLTDAANRRYQPLDFQGVGVAN